MDGKQAAVGAAHQRLAFETVLPREIGDQIVEHMLLAGRRAPVAERRGERLFTGDAEHVFGPAVEIEDCAAIERIAREFGMGS